MPHLLIIDAPYYKHLSKALVSGTEAVLKRAGASWDYQPVPGVLEIPAAVAIALDSGKYDGFVTLGCVIRGETTHYEVVAFESARAIMDLTVKYRLALGNGIQTVENEAQAIARAEPSQLNKGGHAAQAALDMVELREMYRV